MRHAHQRLTAAIMTLNGLKDGSQRTGGHQDAATRPHRILLATFCGLTAPKQHHLVHPLSVWKSATTRATSRSAQRAASVYRWDTSRSPRAISPRSHPISSQFHAMPWMIYNGREATWKPPSTARLLGTPWQEPLDLREVGGLAWLAWGAGLWVWDL